MKKKIIQSLIFFLVLTFPFILNKNLIFSMFDGLEKVGSNTPAGFQISPEMVVFLYTLYEKKGSNLPKSIYHDDSSYYILFDQADMFFDCSYNAKKHGFKINGKDGTVYNSIKKSWEKSGYIHISKEQLIKMLPIGSRINFVKEKIGFPFAERYVITNDKDKYNTEYDYWCKDGEVILVFSNDDILQQIITKTNRIRI